MSHNRLVSNAKLGTHRSGGRLAASKQVVPEAEEHLDLLGSPVTSPQRCTSLREAVEYFELRARFLGKIRFHLEKMLDLATLNAEGKVDEDRAQAYHHHSCTVRQIVATDYNGAPLFTSEAIIAEAGDNENQLVLEGLDLSHPAIATSCQSSITSREQAGAARQAIQKALRYLTVVESSLAAHQSRLSFLNQRIELVG